MTRSSGASSVAMTWDIWVIFSRSRRSSNHRDIDQATKEAEAFANRFRGTIDVPGGPTVGHLRSVLQAFEELIERVERVDAYAHLVHGGHDQAGPS